MSVVARACFLSDFGPLFISLKHRAMPCTRDPMWAHFTEAEEQYQDELTGQIKTRIKSSASSGARLSCYATWIN
jgi:hypothetical protein